ncbi:hypothetical protein PENTCL1PPCAC_9308, partial [Pristionchus entomophagus]
VDEGDLDWLPSQPLALLLHATGSRSLARIAPSIGRHIACVEGLLRDDWSGQRNRVVVVARIDDLHGMGLHVGSWVVLLQLLHGSLGMLQRLRGEHVR